MKKLKWCAFLSCVLLLAAYVVYGKDRPGVEHTRTLPVLTNPTGTWQMYARDSSLTNSWRLVNTHPLTRMTNVVDTSAADTLRIYSSSTSDSSDVYVVGIGSRDSQRVFTRLSLSGTDTVFSGIRHRHFEAMYADTVLLGTLSVKAKKGTSTIATIPAGAQQSYTAHHFVSQREGRLTHFYAQVDPESPAVQIQIRLYRSQHQAIRSPESGFSVLHEVTLGGEYTYRPNVGPENVVADNNDTSAVFSIVSAEKVGYFTSTASVGTSVTAFYVDVSPDQSTWRQTNGVDSVTGANDTKIRSRVIAVDSLFGQPWARFIVNGQGVAGDTAKVLSFITVRRAGLASNPYHKELNAQLPALSYVAVYARAMNGAGRVYVMIQGEDK